MALTCGGASWRVPLVDAWEGIGYGEVPSGRQAGRSGWRGPCPSALTKLFPDHLAACGTDAERRLFRGERGEPLSHVTYVRYTCGR